MQYNAFGKLGFDVSRLGYGMMRLPTRQENGETVIDRDEAKRIVRHAIDHGVTYVDTAYGYHNGQSEIVTGEILKDGYRERVTLTTKLPQWLVKEPADMDRLLDEQLKKLDVPYLDFYLVHALNRDAFHKMQGVGYRAFLDRAKKDGRIRHAGFSFHDDNAAFHEIIDDYDWDMAQIQMNYLDDEDQATLEGLHYAGKRGVPIVIMEPLRGGALASAPKEVKERIENYPVQYSPAEWAFRYIGSFPEVVTVLSGMTAMSQVVDNLRIFDSVKVGCMSEEDYALTASLKAAYKSRMPIGCTHCEYCQPCPQDVKIPDIFEMYNEARMFDRTEGMKGRYARGYVEKQNDASRCVQCGKCEGACPQQLPIIDWLQKVHAEMTAK